MKFNTRQEISNIFSGKMDFGFVEIARRCLGDRSRPMRLDQLNSHDAIDIDEQRSPYAILKRALLDPDFSAALGESLETVFAGAYEAYKPSWAQAFNSVSVQRLEGKQLSVVAAADASAVSPGQKFPPATILGADADFALSKYGFWVRIPMEALINNDVATVQKIIAETVNSLRRAEDDLLFTELQTNSTLFSAGNGNLLTSATLDATNLLAATVKLRAMTAKGTKLRYKPGCLIVPSELERTAEALLANHVLVQETGKMTLLVESRLSETSVTDWYLTCDKKQADSLVMQHLTGYESPKVERTPNPDMFDGVTYRAKTHCSASVANVYGILKAQA